MKQKSYRVCTLGGVLTNKSLWPMVILRRLFKQHLKKALLSITTLAECVCGVQPPVACHDCVLPDTSAVVR